MAITFACEEANNIWGFLSQAVGDLAWPAVALVILYQIRKNGPSLAKIIKSIRYKDAEVVFRESFEEARTSAEGVATEIPLNERQLLSEQAELEKLLLEKRPDIALLDIWKKLENELVKLVRQEGKDNKLLTPQAMLRQLVNREKLSSADIELFDNLRKIRNEVVHSDNVRSLTVGEIREFSDFVDLLIARLRQIGNETK